MKIAEGRPGRVFVIRLEDGDMVPGCIEQFARRNGVSVGYVLLVGGVGAGEVVVGPRESHALPPEPMSLPVDGAHEVAAVGVIAPDEEGRPVLHIHGALGRSGQTLTGCLRRGVRTWLVGEVILCEILGAKVVRTKDPRTGFSLLELGDAPHLTGQ